jgi:hypothetical protein
MIKKIQIKRPEPVFKNLLRSPGIDSQPSGPVRQPYLLYQPARLHRLAESIHIPGLLKRLLREQTCREPECREQVCCGKTWVIKCAGNGEAGSGSATDILVGNKRAGSDRRPAHSTATHREQTS